MTTDQIPQAITRADQMAWESPEIRPIEIPLGTGPMDIGSPCPEWCTREGRGHDPHRAADFPRQHESALINVRQEGVYPFDDGDTVRWAHWRLQLVQATRGAVPRIKIVQVHADRDGELVEAIAGRFYLDEVPELIAVLQHLLKVGRA